MALSSLILKVQGLPLHIPPGQDTHQVDESVEPVFEIDLIPLVPLI